MKKSIYFLSIFFLVIVSCKTNQVLVKFKNETPENIQNLRVNILGKEFIFDNLSSGKSTKFIKVDKTYPYCFVVATTQKDTIAFLPFDYMGERLYTTGKLIMKINLEYKNDSVKSLNIKSRRPIL